MPEGVTLDALDAVAHATSDLKAAQALNRARNELFQRLGREQESAA